MLKLEVGKKYVNRDGKVVTIVLYDHENEYAKNVYPYTGDNGIYYTENGSYYVGDDCESQEDLVKEYKEDEAMLKLEVGKKYVSRCGEIVTIVLYDPVYEYKGCKYPYKGNNYYYYTEYGCFYVGMGGRENTNDLVEEYKQDENMNEENETISKDYITGRVDILIECLMEDCDLITNTGGSEFAVNAIKHCVGKIKEVFNEIM